MKQPCPQCKGRKIVRVSYRGIERRGQQFCAVCDGKGKVDAKPVRRRRIVKEGPEVD